MNVLIADDDPVSQRVLEATLGKWGYGTLACHNGDQAWAVLQEKDAPQLAILDWMMPGLDGLEVCRRVRRKTSGNLVLRSTSPYTYVILLTSRRKKENLIEGLEAGADDYLIKPFNTSELQLRLRAGQRIIELQSAMLALQQKLDIRSTHDDLTQVPNRSYILEILAQELRRGHRETKPVSVIMVDLDYFEEVNRTYGPANGDQVLCEVARRIKSTVRSYDAVGRYGGEEFLIALPGCSLQNAMASAEKVRACIGSTEIITRKGPVAVTVSCGVASSELFDNPDTSSLLVAADRGLFLAKERGRNRVVQTPQ